MQFTDAAYVEKDEKQNAPVVYSSRPCLPLRWNEKTRNQCQQQHEHDSDQG